MHKPLLLSLHMVVKTATHAVPISIPIPFVVGHNSPLSNKPQTLSIPPNNPIPIPTCDNATPVERINSKQLPHIPSLPSPPKPYTKIKPLSPIPTAVRGLVPLSKNLSPQTLSSPKFKIITISCIAGACACCWGNNVPPCPKPYKKLKSYPIDTGGGAGTSTGRGLGVVVTPLPKFPLLIPFVVFAVKTAQFNPSPSFKITIGTIIVLHSILSIFSF